MRIHLVTDQFNLGGGIEHIFQIVKGLPEFRFAVFGQKGNGDALIKFQNLDNVTLMTNGFEAPQLLEGNPHLIHFHHLKPLFHYYRNPFAAHRNTIPTLFTAHGLHIHKYEFYNTLRSRLSYTLRFQLEKHLFKYPQKVITVSEEDQEFLRKKYRLTNTQYLTNGIDVPAVVAGQTQSAPRELRRELGLPLDEYLILTVARFNFQKGYDILVEALKRIKHIALAKGCRFVFVGDGETMTTIRNQVNLYGLQKLILFLGSRTDVYKIMQAADVFLLPSRWEGLPIVALETGLLKLPIVASDTYGNREILKNGRGVLYPNLDINALAQTIENLLDQKYPLTDYADRLLAEVHQNYSLEKMLTGLRNLYSSI